MLVWPSPHGEPSRLDTAARVATDAHLDLAPEPTITVAGSHQRSVTRIELERGATCRVVEEFSLGRSGEASGTIEASLRVLRDGIPLLHHDEAFGARAPAGTTSVGVGGARHVMSVVLVGVDPCGPQTEVTSSGAGARLLLAADACVVLAAGLDRPTVAALVERLTGCVSSDRAGMHYGKTIRPIDA
jgi:urease accessory protein